MNHFPISSTIHSGVCKEHTLIPFLIALQRHITMYERASTPNEHKKSIPYKGLLYTPYNLKLICSYIPELYHINKIQINNWGYQDGNRYRCDQITSDIIDFTTHFNQNDLTSLPIIFNSIPTQSGIYKLTCMFTKHIQLTMGLTDKNNFDDRLIHRTYKPGFYLTDLLWVRNHISLSSVGEYHVNTVNSNNILTNTHTKNVHFTPEHLQHALPNLTMSIIYDSYQNIVYFYEGTICITQQHIHIHPDIEWTPFIHIHYNKMYPTRSQLWNSAISRHVNNISIRFV